MGKVYKSLSFLLLVFLTGCSSTLSFKKKTAISMFAGFAGGYAIGQAQAPKDENKQMHGALYGAAASSLVAAGMIYLMDDSIETKQKARIEVLTKEIEVFKKNKKVSNKGIVVPNISNLPDNIKGLIQPGSWQLYEIDQWVRKGNTLIHQDKELNFEPSKLTK